MPSGPSAIITVDQFLQPPDGHDELRHIVVSTSKSKISSSSHEPVAEIVDEWVEFNTGTLSLTPEMATCLARACEAKWNAWIPEPMRMISSERQLEALYLQTFITRVNIALDNAIPPGEPRLTIVVNSHAFPSASAEAKAEKMIPDWAVIETGYDKLGGAALSTIQKSATAPDFLVVGDTKLVRSNHGNEKAPGSDSCHLNFLGQLQGYARSTRTRFGFILSNKELVVAQFMREAEASPRRVDQRCLRSSTARADLSSGLKSDPLSSSPNDWTHNDNNEISINEPEDRDKSDDASQQQSPTSLPRGSNNKRPRSPTGSSPNASRSRPFHVAMTDHHMSWPLRTGDVSLPSLPSVPAPRPTSSQSIYQSHINSMRAHWQVHK